MPAPLVSRRDLLSAAAASTLLPRVAAAARSPSLNFVAVGDWGRGGADKQREVGEQMGRTATVIGSDFVISAGDNFYEDGVTGIADPQWQSSFEQIYAAASLQTPWYAILGNHDYRGDVAAQIAYSDHSPRWRMPDRWFQRRETLADGTIADFFYLDTSPFIAKYRGTKVRVDDQDTQAQLAWLDDALGRSGARWKIVIGHHPIHTVSGGKRDTKELVRQLKPLLVAHGVHVYVNGHDHNMQSLEVDGVRFITNGAGSKTDPVLQAPQPGQFASSLHGFMTVALSAERFAYSFIDAGGAELFSGAVMG